MLLLLAQDEKQALLHRMHQAEQQSKKNTQQLQQEVVTLKSSSEKYRIVMSNLADDNAKLKAKLRLIFMLILTLLSFDGHSCKII